MNSRPRSATPRPPPQSEPARAPRLCRVNSEIAFLLQILLLLEASGVSAGAQNTADLTIRGVMPATQRLSVSPLRATVSTNQFTFTLEARNNAVAGYEVSIQSKAVPAGAKGVPAAYQVKCGGRSLTLAPGTSTLLSACTGDRHTRALLQISNPGPLREDILTLTVIAQ